MDDKSKRFLAQSIGVVGLNTVSFTEAYEGVYVIAEQMSRHLEDSVVPTWDDKRYLGFPGLRSLKRYFTWKGPNGQAPAVPFASNVNPSNVLLTMGGNTYVHTKDNEVIYRSCITDDEGTPE